VGVEEKQRANQEEKKRDHEGEKQENDLGVPGGKGDG